MSIEDGYDVWTVIDVIPAGNRGMALFHCMAFNGKLTRRISIQSAFLKAQDFADFQAQVKKGEEIEVKIVRNKARTLGCATAVAGWRKVA